MIRERLPGLLYRSSRLAVRAAVANARQRSRFAAYVPAISGDSVHRHHVIVGYHNNIWMIQVRVCMKRKEIQSIGQTQRALRPINDFFAVPVLAPACPFAHLSFFRSTPADLRFCFCFNSSIVSASLVSVSEEGEDFSTSVWLLRGLALNIIFF